MEKGTTIYLLLDLLFFFDSLNFMLDILVTLLQLRQSVLILFQFLREVQSISAASSSASPTDAYLLSQLELFALILEGFKPARKVGVASSFLRLYEKLLRRHMRE